MYAGAISLSQIPEYFLSSSSLQTKIEVLQFKKAAWRLKVGLCQLSSDRFYTLRYSKDSKKFLTVPGLP